MLILCRNRMRLGCIFPPMLALLLFFTCQSVPVTAQAEDRLFSPHIEYHPHGWIDWGSGYIYARGNAALAHNGDSRAKALGAARLVAAANAVKLASGIHLDERRTMAAIGADFALKLKAFLHYRPHSETFHTEGAESYAEVMLKAPLHGIRGLTASLLEYLHSKPLQWHQFPLPDRESVEVSEQAQETWLVVDARNQEVEPGLFPKIVSTTGTTLYAINHVERSALEKRGMARYVFTDAGPEQIMRAQGSAAPPAKYAGGERTLLDLLSPISSAIAAQQQKRPRYILTQAVRASGISRTNMVISAHDAAKLRVEDKASKILRQCRVIVVTASPIDGIEGR